MAYLITTTSGANIATIADGTVNSSTTSLTLIGKNYAGYGNFLNENFVHLLENFSNATAPLAPLTGQLWFDSNALVLKVYNGTQWKPISSSANSATAPTSPVTGDIWWDSVNAQLKVWSGTAWVIVGPTYTSSTGQTGPIVFTITDSSGNPHVVTEFFIQNVIVAILSKDAEFTPQTAIDGFTTIKPGFNLVSATTITGAQFTGDVSNALTLQGVNASQFLRSDQNTSTAYTITAGGGVTIGSDLSLTPTPTTNEVQINNTTINRDLNVYVNSANAKTRVIGITASTAAVAFGNSDVTIGKTLSIAGNTSVAASAYLNILGKTVASNDILPPNTGIVNIGASATQFASVFATTFSGNLQATVITLNGNLVPNFTSVVNYVQATGQNSQGAKTVSASTPSGGSNGDVWYRI